MKEKFKILIVEDEVLIANYISDVLKDDGFIKIEWIKKAHEFLTKAHTFNPHLIIMDINLRGDETGIDLSYLKNESASIIYLTGQFDDATINKALNTNPESYLTKPIKELDLLAAVNLCMKKRSRSKYKFKDGYDIVSLDYNDILYFKADGNYLEIITGTKRYAIRKTIKALLDEIPKSIFIKIHRSFVVNKTKITRQSYTKVFVGDIELPVSRIHDKVMKNTD